MAAAKKGKCFGRCGASSRHTTKLNQSIFFRYLWLSLINIVEWKSRVFTFSIIDGTTKKV
jgi:hypothetical protein